MSHAAERPSHDDDGITLAEVVVYVVLAVIFLGITVSLFAAALSTQAQTSDRDSATGAATAVNASVQSSIRNAVAATVVRDSDGRFVRARVVTGDIDSLDSECRAWILTATGDLMYKTSPSAIARPTEPIPASSGWATLASDVAGTFTYAAPRLSYQFTITDREAAVPITGGVSAQAFIEGAAPC